MDVLVKRKTYFFTDLHADQEAFVKSLQYCDDENALYLIGGDCLDKGPSNLELLLKIKKLSEGVDVKLLAGNHDLRMLMVLQNWENQDDPRLKKIFTPERYEKRITPFINECGGIEAAQEMFLNSTGEFGWFFESLYLFHYDNGALFVHAGVGDELALAMKKITPDILQAKFLEQKNDKDGLCDFYYGPFGTVFRTKYRERDYPLTSVGANIFKKMGVQYVVHGHDNLATGHERRYRAGIPHLMCDCTVDRNTRMHAGLGDSSGFAVAIFDNKSNSIQYYSAEAAGTWS